MSGRFLMVMGAALATTIYQVYRIQTKGGGSTPRSSLFTSSNPFAAPPSSSSSSTVEGVEGYQAQADWGMVRGALTSRLTLHTASLDTLDGRTAAGAGYRSLSIHARPGVVQAATQALLAAPPGSGGDAGPAANATVPPLGGTWLAGVGQHWVPPLLLLSLHETDTNNGFGGEKPRRVRHFFEGKGRTSSTSSTSGRGPGKGPGKASIPKPQRGKASKLDHQGWDERHIPKGPARGKAARAFGAHARGPSLAARTRDPNFAPTLTLQLHVHIPGFTCRLPSGDEESGGGGRSEVNNSSSIGSGNNINIHTSVQDSMQDTGASAPQPYPAAAAAAAGAVTTGSDRDNKGGTENDAGGGSLLPIPLPLPPCPPHFPTLPYFRPATPRARESLHAATREKSTLTASAPVTAPFLTWCEALLAFVLDVKRVNLGEVVGPEGGVVLMGVREMGEEGVSGVWGRRVGEKEKDAGREEREVEEEEREGSTSPPPILPGQEITATTTPITLVDVGGGSEAGAEGGVQEVVMPPPPQALGQEGEVGKKAQALGGEDL